ncbi:hypothetical protein [Thiothrix unzii]
MKRLSSGMAAQLAGMERERSC